MARKHEPMTELSLSYQAPIVLLNHFDARLSQNAQLKDRLSERKKRLKISEEKNKKLTDELILSLVVKNDLVGVLSSCTKTLTRWVSVEWSRFCYQLQ